MAGSYKHLVNDETGEFWFDLIENMHDAAQACHMCFWMIRHLADGDEAAIARAEELYYAHMRGEDVSDYSKMTQQEFDDILDEVVDKHTASSLIRLVPNIYTEVCEFFNNEVLDEWKSRQPDEEEEEEEEEDE